MNTDEFIQAIMEEVEEVIADAMRRGAVGPNYDEIPIWFATSPTETFRVLSIYNENDEVLVDLEKVE